MTFAQFVGSGSDGIIGVVNTIVVPSIGALIFLFFIWSIVNYFFLHSDDETERKKGREFVLWGIIGIVIFFSVWGFINIALSTLGITRGG